MSGDDWSKEVSRGERFRFGRNWSRFLAGLDEEKVLAAESSLKAMLSVQRLDGKTFLDIGCGSGIFSLAARRLGATVCSFDFDPESVNCAAELRSRFFPGDERWRVLQGSILDKDFLESLGSFDVVYSWGVLHHTGDMWAAIDNAILRCGPNGTMFIALYNFQPIAGRYWTTVKKCYNKFPMSRPIWVGVHVIYPVLPGMLLRWVSKRTLPRGMNAWYDLLDWLGGYPFESCKPEEVVSHFLSRGFFLRRLKTVGGRLGCNEYLLTRFTDKN
jgi:SAM-dependent methyltransferase